MGTVGDSAVLPSMGYLTELNDDDHLCCYLAWLFVVGFLQGIISSQPLSCGLTKQYLPACSWFIGEVGIFHGVHGVQAVVIVMFATF